MSAERTTRLFTAAACTAALLFTVSVSTVNAALEIRHSSGARYDADLTRAYEPCVAPNDMSSGGVPACSPPVTSACDYSRGLVRMQKVKHEPKIEVNVSLTNVSGPGSCASGPYIAYFNLRVSADDAGCTSGQCTWIEGTQIALPLQQHTNDFVLDDVLFEDAILASYGIVAGHVANYEIVGVTIDGPDGLAIAAAGTGSHSANAFRSDVTVRYPACGTPDTATASGVPACSSPVWGASCDFSTGEIRLKDGSGVPIVIGQFHDLVGASPSCADGSYTIETVVRATGDVCSGSPCTLVDTLVGTNVPAIDGFIGIDDGSALALAGSFETVELLDAFIRDPLGEPLATTGVTNAFLLGDPAARISFRDLGNPTDDRVSLRAAFPRPPIDPTVDGATFTVTDQNGSVYSVTIPANAWQTLRPMKWQYKDPLGSIGGVRKASIKQYKIGGGPAGFKLRLKASGIDLSAADLPSVNVVFSAANTTSGISIGERNVICRLKPKGLNCHL